MTKDIHSNKNVCWRCYPSLELAIVFLLFVLLQGFLLSEFSSDSGSLRAQRIHQEQPQESLVDYVDVVRGLFPANRDFSHGNVLPLLSMPRGMTHWSATTTENLEESWYFEPGHVSLAGIRCTHQPSPWMGDYGQFLVSAQVENLGSPYFGKINQIQYKPHLFNASLANYCTEESCARFEFAPSARGGLMRITFPHGLKQFRKIFKISFLKSQGDIHYSQDFASFHGYSTSNNGGVVNSTVFKHHFSGHLEYLGQQLDREDFKIETTCNARLCTGAVSWKYVGSGDDVVQIRIGTSFISEKQAAINRERELTPHVTLDSLVEEGKNDWNKLLERLEVNDPDSTPEDILVKKKKTLYTHLYRSLLFPRDLAEIDEEGNEVHFSPYDKDGAVLPGPLCTDSGFWDAYRAVYPMLHLVYPDIVARIMKGWINAAKENRGRVPQWGSPGPRREMVGSMSDVSIAEAIANGVFKDANDLDVAYNNLLLNAYRAGDEDSRGPDLDLYISKGYFPLKVAETLNAKLADFAISQVAFAKGDNKTGQDLLQRAMNWHILFDKSRGFFRPKGMDGKFVEPFDEYEWNLPVYTEGGPWQYRFYVPFAGAALAEAYENSNVPRSNGEGRSALCETLLRAVRQRPAFRMSEVIHEATEMANNCFGQYAHNNQPSHHILYMFAHSGCPLQGQKWIQHTVQTLYGEFGYPGDEDNGEMSSWHILSALGLYALIPGTAKYQVGAPPWFQEMIIHPDGVVRTDPLKITRRHLPSFPLNDDTPSSDDEPYYRVSRRVLWNGNVLSLAGGAVSLSYQELLRGGTLEFLP